MSSNRGGFRDTLARFAEATTGRSQPFLEQQRRQDLGNILSGQSIPTFARAGGAEPRTPEQNRQQQLQQLAQLGTPQSLQVLSGLSPLTQGQKPREVTSDVGGFKRFIDTGERAFPQAQKPRDVSQELSERKFQLELKKFDQKQKAGGLEPKDIFEQSQKLRKEFTGLSGDFIKQRDAFGRVQASAKDPSAAGDLALIFNFMKVLDPGSTVREGEFATAQNSGSVPDSIRARYNKIISGERLTEKLRNDFVDRSTKLFASASKQHDKRVKQFTGVAQRAGLDPQDILLDLGLAEEEPQAEVAPSAPPTAPPAPQAGGEGTIATNPQTGQRVVLRGGQWQPL